MPASTIKRFYFYDQYIWQASDFDNFQTWLDNTIGALSEGLAGAAVLSGLTVTPNGGLQVAVASGLAVNINGRVLYVPTTQTANFVANGSNPVRHLLVLRPLDTDTDNITSPTAPPALVPLHRRLDYSLVVISGTPAGSPVYPAAGASDVIIAGITLATSQASIAQSDIDRQVINTRRPKMFAMKQIASNYSVLTSDEVIEMSATGGNITSTLPPAISMVGQMLDVVKIDSTANKAIIAGNGGELISGRSSITLDDQWQSSRFFSTGTAWRAL